MFTLRNNHHQLTCSIMDSHYVFNHKIKLVDNGFDYCDTWDVYNCTSHRLNGGSYNEDDCLLQIVESLDSCYYSQLTEGYEGISSIKVCKWLGDRGITWEFVRIP